MSADGLLDGRVAVVMGGGGGMGLASVSGLLAGWIGPLETLVLYGAALLVFVAVVAVATRVTRLD